MQIFKNNLKTLLKKNSISEKDFLEQNGVKSIEELKLSTISNLVKDAGINFENFMAYPHFLEGKKANVKLLLLDVDGVMTDAGMYFTQNGDQIKKYNAKDGMAIMRLSKYNIQTGIISSGFKHKLVKDRADLLNIDHFYVGRDKKINILNEWIEKLNISLENVAMIGDDINDLEIIKKVGFSACPADAVDIIKRNVSVVLTKKGGQGCVRELIDHFILPEPIS